MARVTTSDVEEIIATGLSSLDAFITAASLQVDRIDALGTLDDDELKEIERWLAAHFVAIRDKRTVKDSMGDASHTYGGKTGYGLDFTSYGQQAKALDSTGTLSNLSMRKASLGYLGGTVNSAGEVET